MTTVYATSDQVAAFLQVTAFSESTSPTKAQVEEWINEAEGEIEENTMHAWQTKTITEEAHDLKSTAYRNYDGTQIFLAHRKIKELSSDDNDKLEIWNGSEYEDYLVTRTEGRNNDYWFDKTLGIIFIKTYPAPFYSSRTLNLRVTYRYGEATVKTDIRKAAIRLAAIAVIQSDDCSVLVREGGDNIPLTTKTEKWQAEADKIISKNRELKLAVL